MTKFPGPRHRVLICLLQLVLRGAAFAPHVDRRKLSTAPSSLSPLSMSKETVAVIGGGVAGLSCAKALSESGKFLPTVFDTGRLRPGGRCSSRQPGDQPKGVRENYTVLSNAVVDHAAQILTVPEGFDGFQKQVDEWEEDGIIQKFPEGTVCDIANPYNRNTKQYDKTKVRLRPLKGTMYYGLQGMGTIPEAMTGGFPLEQDVWVSPSSGVRYINANGGKQWQIRAKGQTLGEFDKLIIAHNGKCADRLMSTTPAKSLHRLLQVKFAPYVPKTGGDRMTLNSIYSLSIAIDRDTSPLTAALPEDKFISGFVKNNPNLRFLSCNTRKHKAGGSTEIWTVLSSAKFGKSHKGPQENLPDDLIEDVTGKLLESLEQALCLQKGSLRGPQDEPAGTGCIIESRLQLWGAAVPLNTWSADDGSEGFLYDAEHGIGTCGDWLLDPSIAGAWESGRRLADYMCSGVEETKGLEGSFQASVAVDKVGIGSLQ